MIWTLAWRNLWRNRFRTTVLIGSIALGILSGVLIASWTNGLIVQRLDTVIGDELGHLQIHQPDFLNERDVNHTIPNGVHIFTELKHDVRIRSIAPRLLVDAMIQSPTVTSGVQLTAIDPDLERETTRFHRHVLEGDLSHSDGPLPPIQISRLLSERLQVHPGERVVLSFQNQEQELISLAFIIHSIYDSRVRERDLRWAFVRIEDLTPHLFTEPSLHELVLSLHHTEDAEIIAEEINETYTGVLAETWYQLSPELRYLTDAGSSLSVYVLGIVLFALAFGILNTLLMSIFERSAELSMLLAIGLNRARLFIMILLESFFITTIGGLIGLAITWPLLQWLYERGIDLTRFGGDSLELWGFDAVVHPVMTQTDLVTIPLLIFFTSILAALWPAIRAVRLHPIHRAQT